jgi:hypothetical protein
MKSFPFLIVLLSLSFALASCGDGSGSGPARTQPQEQQPENGTGQGDNGNGDDDGSDGDDGNDEDRPAGPWGDEFETRINNNLKIEGEKCQGGETFEDLDTGETRVCEADQWMVTVDDQNTCGDEGICTQIFVPPFLARLEEDRRTRRYQYLEIKPEQPVRDGITEVLEQYLVRFNRDGEGKVVERN